jgi:20S proteasome subunit beta 6
VGQVGHKNRNDPRQELTLERAIAIVKDIFVVATERDIYTGDGVEIKVIQASGVTSEYFPLRTD